MITPSQPTELTRPVRVLVVDDEASVRDLIGRWLCSAGYECVLADSAIQANAVLARKSIDIVTTDINMPGLSGVDWLPQLRQLYPNLAVLMLTGCEDVRLAISTLSQGAWGYLIKPVEKQDLLFQVSRAIERGQMLAAQRDHTQVLERTVRDQTQMLQDSHEETVARLIAASQVHNDETGAHIRRIGLFSAIIAESLGWSAQDVDKIRLAAPMHDIGKIGIPDAVLRKPGKLTPQEYDVMKTHTTIGAAILADSQLPMLQMAEQIARSHHERWDGGGYPDRLCGEAIPLAARIVSVVDVYDALSHDRVYRPALPQDEVLTIMDEGAVGQFDPTVLATFFQSLPLLQHLLDKNSLVPTHCISPSAPRRMARAFQAVT